MGHNALQFLSFYCLYTPHFTSTSHTRPSYQSRYRFVTQTAVGSIHPSLSSPELRLVRCSRHQQGPPKPTRIGGTCMGKSIGFELINQYISTLASCGALFEDYYEQLHLR